MNIIQLAVGILKGIELNQQERFVKYVPATGNVYVYRHTPIDGTHGAVHFSKQVQFLSGATRNTFVYCSLLDATDETATFRYRFEEASSYFTIDSSRIVVVD